MKKIRCWECGQWFKETPEFDGGVGSRFCSVYCSNQEYERGVLGEVESLRVQGYEDPWAEHHKRWTDKMEKRGIFKD